MNVKVKDLKEILKTCPDEMDVIIPVINEDDANDIIAFRHVRTAGILSEPGEEDALCLNTSADGVDIFNQIKMFNGTVSCKKILR